MYCHQFLPPHDNAYVLEISLCFDNACVSLVTPYSQSNPIPKRVKSSLHFFQLDVLFQKDSLSHSAFIFVKALFFCFFFHFHFFFLLIKCADNSILGVIYMRSEQVGLQ